MGTHCLLCTGGIHTQQTMNCQLVCPRTPAPAEFFSVWCPETTGRSPDLAPEDSDSHVPQQLAVGQRGPKSESCPALAQPELSDELLGLPGSRELQPLQGKRRTGGGWCGWMQPPNSSLTLSGLFHASPLAHRIPSLTAPFALPLPGLVLPL